MVKRHTHYIIVLPYPLALSCAMGKYVWICQGQLHSTPQCIESCIISNMLCTESWMHLLWQNWFTADTSHTWKKNSLTRNVPRMSCLDLFVFSIGWSSRICAAQTKGTIWFSAAGRTISASGLNMQVASCLLKAGRIWTPTFDHRPWKKNEQAPSCEG